MTIIVKSKARRYSENERPKTKGERRPLDSAESLLNRTPLFWIPPQAETRSHSRFYNPADGSLHTAESFPEENRVCICVGASQGYLIMLEYFAASEDPYFIPSLFKPLSGTQHPLPKIDADRFKSPCFDRAGESGTQITTGIIRESLVHKAILTSDPTECESRGRFTVVLLVGDEGRRRISICAPFSDYAWKELDGADSVPYLDVCSSSDGFLFALGGNYSLDVWDIRWEDTDSPKKVKSLALTVPEPFPVGETDCCVSRFYIVKPEIGADIDAMPMLVARIVAEFVDAEGNVVRDPEMEPPAEGSNHPAVFPDRTVGFEVYKMDADRRNWVKAANLGGNEEQRRALFLGGNHSASVPAGGEVAADCIYYTDD